MQLQAGTFNYHLFYRKKYMATKKNYNFFNYVPEHDSISQIVINFMLKLLSGFLTPALYSMYSCYTGQCEVYRQTYDCLVQYATCNIQKYGHPT